MRYSGMRKLDFIGLLALTPILLATDIVIAPSEAGPPPTIDQKRLSLEQYNHEFDLEIDSLVDELAKVIPTTEVDGLRREFYEWRLQRDRDCAEKARVASEDLVELECRRRKSDEYYQRLRTKLERVQPGQVDRSS